jgi:undecaprenyl diphosphate synthase
VRIIGEREGLPSDILPLLTEAEKLTSENTGQTLVIAFNYGSRGEIVSAARRLAKMAAKGAIDPDAIDTAKFESMLDTHGIPDPDLIIRTSGEQRLSNFLLWQAAYAELVFVDVLWPDFDETHLAAAIESYTTRRRRFGGINESEESRGLGS